MFDEMYLQKQEEYTGGELANTSWPWLQSIQRNHEFHDCRIEGNVPFVVKYIPETGVTETR